MLQNDHLSHSFEGIPPPKRWLFRGQENENYPLKIWKEESKVKLLFLLRIFCHSDLDSRKLQAILPD